MQDGLRRIRQSARPSDGAERSVKIVLKVVTTENYSGVGSLGETKATNRSEARDQLSNNITRASSASEQTRIRHDPLEGGE